MGTEERRKKIAEQSAKEHEAQWKADKERYKDLKDMAANAHGRDEKSLDKETEANRKKLAEQSEKEHEAQWKADKERYKDLKDMAANAHGRDEKSLDKET